MKSSRLKRNRMWKSLVKKSKRFNVPKVTTKPNSKVVVQICYTKSMVDIIWQVCTFPLDFSCIIIFFIHFISKRAAGRSIVIINNEHKLKTAKMYKQIN